jgi:Apea-like HEPN
MKKQATSPQLYIEVPIISNSSYDLSKFDFAFEDLYITEITTTDFQDYIKSLAVEEHYSSNSTFIGEIIKNNEKDQKLYAVIKRNFRKKYCQTKIENVFKLLLIIFPSDLQILYRISFREYNGDYLSEGLYAPEFPKRYPDRPLISRDNMLSEINDFIKIAFPVMLKHSYLDLSIFHYITSFNASHTHYDLITLCMALESIVIAETELSYRLKRNCAIIVGRDFKSSSIIYSNANLIYTLRSKIVHGVNFNPVNIQSYLPYLRTLTSRMLIELFVHDIGLDDLNNKITELGYGDRAKISYKYQEFALNTVTFAQVQQEELPNLIK